MTRLLEVFRFELAWQLRRVSTAIYGALFLGVTGVLARVFFLDARQDGFAFNAPIVTAAVTVIASMIALLVAAGVAGDAATRDASARMDALLFTTPVGKAAYLGGRFLGAFAVTALLVMVVPLALLLTTRMPGIEPQLLGPFHAGGYRNAYLLFALPNAFVGTAVIFSIAALTRRAIASYAGAAFLFFFATITEAFLAGRMGQWDVAKLLDPLGFTTVRALWRSLNPLQRSTTAIVLDDALLTNRLLWIGIALATMAFACTRFRFAHAATGGKRRPIEPAVRWTGVVVPPARRVFGLRTRLRQLLAVAVRSLRELLASRGWWIVPFVAALAIITGPELLEVELGAPGAATSARVAETFGASENALLLTLLIALSAGELVWRERDARIDAIADVTPVPEWLTFLGKFLALGLMLAGTQAIFLASGIALQVMEGVHRFDLGIYLQILFGAQLSGYLLIAALAMVAHVLIDQKYVANVVVVLAFVGLDMLREIGVRHNLLLYGGAPAWSYSEMAGFASQIEPWLWFRLYWSGWALLFAVLAYLFWVRGAERGLRPRLALARRRLTRGPVAIGTAALAIIVGAGTFVFFNTNVLHRYRTDAELDRHRDEYERLYGQYATLAQPVLAATKLHVEFYPERGAATVRGSYRLENRSAVAIGSIHVVVHPEVETTVGLERGARATLADDDHGYRIYALDKALLPRESLRMNFAVRFTPRGFTNEGRNPSVLPNGSWIQHRAEQSHGARQWLPMVGYQTNRERDDGDRPLSDVAARSATAGREKIAFEAVVGTSAGQIGVTTGALRRTWTANGRSYAHYVADAPISNGYVLYSARYAVLRASWRDVAIEIYHHPAHTRNLGRMLRSVRASLDHHTRTFGPYPHKQLRLIEFPSSGRGLGLTAHESAIKFSEGYALVRPEDDEREIDLPFAVMAHEMAHQWWGHQVVPARVEGAAVLSESLAWYSGMQVVEKTLGRDHLQRLLAIMRGEYLAPHQTREVPLLRAVDRLDAYRTGPFAMYALREAVGEAKVDAALRNLLRKFDPRRPPYPTSLDLYAELRAVTPASQHPLLRDLFEEITFWDLRTRSIDVRPAGGAYRVTLHIDAQKLKGDATGRERSAAMNDRIDVALFDAAGKTVYRQPHRIRSGMQSITVTVPRMPSRGGVDPDHVLLDRKPEDNVIECATSAR